MTRPLSDFRIVLVAPLYSGNIGSVARLAGNFGVDEVFLVQPQCDWCDDFAQKFACKNAQERLRSFRVVDSLHEALTGCTASIAFTRRIGDIRQTDLDVGSVAPLAIDGKVGLVFGREDIGLKHEEVLDCTHICTLAALAESASFNLSQAVCIALYRIFEDINRDGANPAWHSAGTNLPTVEPLATHEQLQQLYAHWRQTMVDAGLTEAGNPDRMLGHIKRLIGRARVSLREVNLLRGFLSKTQVHMGTRRSYRQPPSKSFHPGNDSVDS